MFVSFHALIATGSEHWHITQHQCACFLGYLPRFPMSICCSQALSISTW